MNSLKGTCFLIREHYFHIVISPKQRYNINKDSRKGGLLYARGDYTPESDVDIMILVDLPDDELYQYADELAEVGFEYNVAHDIWMMPVVRNQEHFNHWVDAYPFYENVQKEGVKLYEAA